MTVGFKTLFRTKNVYDMPIARQIKYSRINRFYWSRMIRITSFRRLNWRRWH